MHLGLFPLTHTHTHTHTHTQFIVENRKAQKYLLGVFEMLVGEKEQLKAKVPHILKAFYDHDIVEEEALLEWADKVRERGREGRGE